MRRREAILLVLALPVVAACVAISVVMLHTPEMITEHVNFASLDEVPPSAWQRLAGQRIYFGHQSVGYNILGGLRSILSERGDVRLPIVEISAPAEIDRPMLAHSRVGQNGDPLSKLRAFEALIEGGLAEQVDIALFKFCYVDVTAATDVESLFAEYRATMDRLTQAHPHVQFVHVTVPLTVRRTGARAAAGRLLGRADDNVARGRFNELLRARYASRALLFDLARREATAPDGLASGYSRDGRGWKAWHPTTPTTADT